MSPRVSVVIGAYNEANNIETCLQSVLGQTYSDFEVIVVDDGSTDDTVSKVEGFDDRRVTIIRNPKNEGLPASLNRGIEAASGEYIARMDADEFSLPNRFERQVSVLDSDDSVKVVGCDYRVVGRNGGKIAEKRIDRRRTFDVDDLLENGPGIAHGSAMFRRSAFLEVGGYRTEFTLAQDYDLWLRMAAEYGGGFIAVVPECLYERAISVEQITKRGAQRRFAEIARERARKGYERPPDIPGDVEKVSPGSDRRRESQYRYLEGYHRLEDGQRTRGRINLLHSILLNPASVYPWYRLCLSFLPSTLERRVSQLVRNSMDDASFGRD